MLSIPHNDYPIVILVEIAIVEFVHCLKEKKNNYAIEELNSTNDIINLPIAIQFSQFSFDSHF